MNNKITDVFDDTFDDDYDNDYEAEYDDGNIPDIDLPGRSFVNSVNPGDRIQPLPESFRPRKDGPQGQ